jgi:hypothetical protein
MYVQRGMVPLIMKFATGVLAIVSIGGISCQPWEKVG